MAKITTLIIDLDGCLTDGRQFVTWVGGKMCKTFHARDRMTIRRLLSAGYDVLVVSADDWPGAQMWVEGIVGTNGTAAKFQHTRQKHTLQMDWASCLGVGDDIEDAPFLEKCAMAYCPKDADPRLTVERLPVDGGRGIMGYIEAVLDNLKITNNAIHYRAGLAP